MIEFKLADPTLEIDMQTFLLTTMSAVVWAFVLA
jgi:hypothetical protein